MKFLKYSDNTEFPYTIEGNIGDLLVVMKYHNWMTENMTSKWEIKFDERAFLVFCFESETDLMHFKLRWL